MIIKLIPQKFRFLLIVLPLLSLIYACEKDLDNGYQVNDYPSMDAFWEDFGPRQQVFLIGSYSENIITGENGVIVQIPANAFETKNGVPVDGVVRVEMREMLDAGSMIMADRATVSNGRLLSSGGQLYLNASQGGQDLRLRDGASVSVNVPTTSVDPNMQLFVGNDSSGVFNWQATNVSVADTTANDTSSTNDTTGTGGGGAGGSGGWTPPITDSLDYYRMQLQQLFNWINCDYFWSDPRPTTSFEVHVPDGHDDSNTKSFVYLPSINSVVPVYRYSNGVFTVGPGYYLPIGIDAVFVTISYKNNTIYYSISSTTIKQNHIEQVIFKSITKQQLQQLLQSL